MASRPSQDAEAAGRAHRHARVDAVVLRLRRRPADRRHRPDRGEPENGEVARFIADELAMALTRSGVAVATQARSARYHLAGAMRGAGRQTRLILRLSEVDTGRHLWPITPIAPSTTMPVSEEHLAARNRRFASALPASRRDRSRRTKPDTELRPVRFDLAAMPGVLSLDADGNARALDLLQRAMDRDPAHALATALAA